MLVLVLNSGSSSLKFQLVEIPPYRVLSKGVMERIGLPDAVLKYQAVHTDKKVIEREDAHNHESALRLIFDILVDPDLGVIPSVNVIEAVGHRVVHGGEEFSESVLINQKVIRILEENTALAPLHNPPNLMGIYACLELLPEVPQVAVFDTAFHRSIPPEAYLYGLPYEFYEREGVRRYGFHGSSHHYISRRAAELSDIPLEKSRIVSCHLGSGASLSAVRGGVSVDTSMGYTPLEGVLMATRCGDVDPYIPLYLMRRHDMSLEEANDFLNKYCGVLGLSGIKGDMLDVEKAALKGNIRAELALRTYCYRVRKYIGAYTAIMGGLDIIVFTGGVGENSPVLREQILQGLEFMGVMLDREKNKNLRGEGEISSDSSRVRVWVIPANEEFIITHDTFNLVGKTITRPTVI